MPEFKCFKRTTECPNGWWIKGKVYVVRYNLGKARLTDEEGFHLYLKNNPEYLCDNFERRG